MQQASVNDAQTLSVQKDNEHSSVPVSSSVSSSSVSEPENEAETEIFDDSNLNFEMDTAPDLESISSPGSSHKPRWSMISASPDLLTMRSPMVHSSGYDPNRIPSSIFSTKASNPADWSIASNESLFSVHMGKSGELFRLDDYNYTYPYYRKSCELSGTLPTVMEVSAHEESSAKSSNVSPRHGKTDSFQVEVDIHGSKKMVESGKHHPSLSNPRLSVGSGNSVTSFAFPVLTKDGSKASSPRLSTTVKEEKEEAQEQQQQESIEPAKTTSVRKWFSWFSCWPRSCC